jgi:diguanylate cyclase (GGDEF)-like protein
VNNGGTFSRRMNPVSGSWPMVLLDLTAVVVLVSLAKAVSDGASSPVARWVWFVGLSTVLVFALVAVPMRVLLLRQQRGMHAATMLARRQAETDPLTGLLNRRSLEGVVHSLLSDRVAFSVSICDLDSFKQLNDNHGHDVGDRALRLFANTLRGVVRNGDFVARVGGEEFVVILPESAKRNGFDVLERARLRLGAQLRAETMPRFTFSAGVADTSEVKDWTELMRLADQRLLAAKRAGRDRVLASMA